MTRQLAFVREALDRGAGEEAQERFPEGCFLLHALYGLAWVELGHRSGDRATALRQARWTLAKLDSPAGRATFDADLASAYGAFYAGWTTWLRGGVSSLQPADRRDASEVRRLEPALRRAEMCLSSHVDNKLRAPVGQVARG